MKNPGFLNKEALLCEECFLNLISKSSLEFDILKKKIPFTNQFVGTRNLNPELTKKRVSF